MVSLLAAASVWFYVDKILVGYQVADAAAHDRPRGNLSDLYPRWLGARELLLRGRNPYSPEITAEIQKEYYGRVLDASRPDDPRDQQGFAYPVYVVFLLAPMIGLSFSTVQIVFHWLLIAFTAASVLLWLRTLQWRLPGLVIASCIALTLGSLPVVQGNKLQQLSLLVAALLAASAASVAGGFLFVGGMFLELATIKPQLAGPLVAWLLIWAVCDWKSRRRLVLGFGAMMVLLLVGSELVLPGWWRMFLEAVRRLSKQVSVSCEIIGDGPMRQTWQDATEQLGLGSIVKFSGFMSQPECAQRLQQACERAFPDQPVDERRRQRGQAPDADGCPEHGADEHVADSREPKIVAELDEHAERERRGVQREEDDRRGRRHQVWQERQPDQADAEAGQALHEAGGRDDHRAEQPERQGGRA